MTNSDKERKEMHEWAIEQQLTGLKDKVIMVWTAIFYQTSVETTADSGVKLISRQKPHLIHETRVCGQFQLINEQLFIKAKWILSFKKDFLDNLETDTKAREEEKNKIELFGSLKSGIKEIQKQDA